MKDFKNTLMQYSNVNENVSLKTCTTLRVGGIAQYVVYPKSMMALSQIINECKAFNMPFKVIGKGSNLLCSDKEYKGVIIRLDRTFCEYYINDDECLAEAGCSIIALSYALMKEGLSGLEFASGIPGTVGGVTFMNAGAYKSSMKDIISEVFVYRNNEFVWMSNEDCQFSYRHSIFHEHTDWIVLAIKFKLKKMDYKDIREVIENRRQRRMNTQPLNTPSAGSFFKNFEDCFAWQCIDEIGYRGKKIGGAMVSEKHSNFLVNYDNASAGDFITLINDIQHEVYKKFNKKLIMEVEKFNFE